MSRNEEKESLSTRIPHDLDKLQLLGRLVSGITHEINTPMHYLENNLAFLKVACNDLLKLQIRCREMLVRVQAGETINDSDWRMLEKIEADVEPDYLADEIVQAIAQSIEGVDMVSRIVLALKDFSHPSLHEFSLTDINKCIETVCTIARHEWKRVAELQIEAADNLPFIFCSRDEVHQILLNLIVNAAHAVGEKISQKKYDRGLIKVKTIGHQDKVEILIEDDGCGILPENQSRIFEPHFTTKKAGAGTGLGLNLVKNIVEERHGGKLEFFSEPGTGTTFKVVLPHRPAPGEEK